MTEDIRIKITADDAQAVQSFKRLGKEAANTSQRMKNIGQEGSKLSKGLQSIGQVAGPEFGALAGSLERASGAMAGLGEAGLLAKAGLVAMVAVGSVQVSNMINDWIWQTEEWTKKTEEAIKSIAADQAYLNKQSQDHFDLEMKIIEAAATEEQKLAEFRKLEDQKKAERWLAEEQLTKDKRKLEAALANDKLGYGTEDNKINEDAVKLQEEKVKLLNEQLRLIDQGIAGPSERELELERRQKAKQPEREVRKESASQIPELKAEQQRMITRGNGGRDIDRLIEIAKQQQALNQKDSAETREIRKTLWQIRDKFPDEVFE